MPRYKRTAADAQLDPPVEPEMAPEINETLAKVRNMWEFASLMQYIFLFGHVVKIDDDLDIEDLEAECLKPSPSSKLAHIGLQLLKYVSSHRGLTLEIFDEYTRRQYLAKAPQSNPFGDDEEPLKFNEMDIFTRIKILQQLSTWTLGNVDRIRGLMPEDEDHLNWRMDPLGWDKEDRSYYVLDDNRLYRRSDEPVPPPSPPPKAKSKGKSKAAKSRTSRGTRMSKRRKVDDTEDEEPEEAAGPERDDADDTLLTNIDASQPAEEPGYGFTSKTWECMAITLGEYQDFMANIFRSRDANEKALRARIEEDVLPIIEKRAEALQQKQMRKLRELENISKMATAKRSSRLADKAEKEKQEQDVRYAEEKKQADLRMAREEQERQRRIEEGHESRRLTREQRVREREAKRILHEEELARLESDGDRLGSNEADSDAGDGKRISERQRQTQLEQHKKELEKLGEVDGWYFDCSVCGKHGDNMDDGTHSIACDRCSVWQHSKCHGFSPKQAEHADFTFICGTCKRKEEDAKKPKIPPLKLTKLASASPDDQKVTSRPSTASDQQSHNRLPDHVIRQLDGMANSQYPRPSPGPFGQITNGPNLSPQGQLQGPPGYRYPPIGNFASQAPQAWQSSPPPTTGQPGNYPGSPPTGNAFAPIHHQQQHQYAHQNALVSAGGHYQHPYNPNAQPNGYSPHPPAYPMGQPPPYPQQYQYPQYQQQYPQPPRPGSGHLMNGFQSPAKPAAKPNSSPPASQQQNPYPLQRSPQTHLPPPAQSQQQRPVQSPVKSSPPAFRERPSPQPPQLSRPSPSANGYQSNQLGVQPNQSRTPQMQRPISADGAIHANSVAADGMSGPWPEGSKVIPQKHDQSPALPSSAQGIGEKRIFPPNTPLVPSPNQQNAPTGAESIPVKKMPNLKPELEAPTKVDGLSQG